MSRIPLPILALISFAGYLLLAWWFPLLPQYGALPLADVRSLAPTTLDGIGYAALLLLLFAVLGLAHRRVVLWDNLGTSRTSQPALLILTGALFSLPLLLVYPINATDIYRYYIQGRITTVYRENPLEAAPADFPEDPYARFAGEWIDESSPYGPLWEVAAAGVTMVARDSLLAGLVLFKALGAGCYILVGALIWLLGVRLPPGQRLGRLLLWCWNPALLLVFVIDAHNDALMLLWLALGYFLWQRGHPLTGFLVMCLAPLTKPIGALPLPILLLGILHALPNHRQRLRFLLAAMIGGLALAALAFRPFGSPLVLMQRLLREASLHGGFSPVTLVILLAQAVGAPVSYAVFVRFGTLLFAGLFIWLTWLTWRGRSAARSAADVLISYVATAFTFRIWYSAWPFPWLLIDDSGPSWRLHAGLWFLLCAQLSVVIYGHLRHNLLGGSQLVAHLIGVSFVFLLPLILGRYTARRKLFAIG